MAVQETKEQQQMYALFRSCIYIFLVIEILLHFPFVTGDGMWGGVFLKTLDAFKIFSTIWGCKIAELIAVGVTCIGTRAVKDIKFDMKKMVIYPCAIGGVFTLLCLIFFSIDGDLIGRNVSISGGRILYAIFSVLGIVALHLGLDNLSKYVNSKVGDDKFNFENESFQQEEKLIETPQSVNIPMFFYWKKKLKKGWINVTNPFRGTIVLGTPGSGKSFGIIDPFIRQHSKKGFAMMVYDYKFPTLAKTLFYQYCKNQKLGLLPKNCGFKVINFSNVEYSHRVNPIQKKYIPDLAASLETAATLLAALHKGGGDKKGGSEAFFNNSAENFLAAIIYFFVNFRPRGWKNGKKLKQFVWCNGEILEIKFSGWEGVIACSIDKKENYKVVLDFIDKDGTNVAVEDDGTLKNLLGLGYYNQDGDYIHIEKYWYAEDANSAPVEPDAIIGEFSDMAHVLAFLGRSYDDVFDILMKDRKIASLMAPFQSAHKNKAMDQLEGMVGTLRVNTARLVSPEAYWIFSGDDFDLKISDRDNPTYLVIANDPEKEEVIGSLNALILNRLVAKVNSKGNVPVSIIVDELPTLYFHKIDRLIGTARSNKVSVTLGFQELPQLEADYGKVGMHKIISTCGNVFMGAARNKETLEWAQNDIFGKVKQESHSMTIADDKNPSFTISEKMDHLIPASKIADMATGWLAGQSARDFSPNKSGDFSNFDINDSDDFKTSKYFCKTNFNMEEIAREESAYVELPLIYEFGSNREKERILNQNFSRINDEIEYLIKDILGRVS